jgi:hypothetical protein
VLAKLAGTAPTIEDDACAILGGDLHTRGIAAIFGRRGPRRWDGAASPPETYLQGDATRSRRYSLDPQQESCSTAEGRRSHNAGCKLAAL